MINSQHPVLTLVALAAIYFLRQAFRRRSRTASSQSDPNQAMPQLAELAVRFAAEKGTMLDFAPNSVRSVELPLAQLHALRVKGELSDQELNRHAMCFGAYIGEVIRRLHGRSWDIDHPVIGPQTFPLTWQDRNAFPVAWCGKQILNGEEDNVWFKFQVVTASEPPESMTSAPEP